MKIRAVSARRDRAVIDQGNRSQRSSSASIYSVFGGNVRVRRRLRSVYYRFIGTEDGNEWGVRAVCLVL